MNYLNMIVWYFIRFICYQLKQGDILATVAIELQM